MERKKQKNSTTEDEMKNRREQIEQLQYEDN